MLFISKFYIKLCLVFNSFSQSFGLAHSGRSSVSNTGMNASSSGMFNPRDLGKFNSINPINAYLAAAQVVAQQQAAYEAAAMAFVNGDFNTYHGHPQSIANNYNNKM